MIKLISETPDAKICFEIDDEELCVSALIQHVSVFIKAAGFSFDGDLVIGEQLPSQDYAAQNQALNTLLPGEATYGSIEVY